MIIPFSKYHGAGNDFIMIDNTCLIFGKYSEDYGLISKLCHRRFGIGADGLILINKTDMAGFEMVYYNSDGRPGTMCGNGGRCSMAFANALKLVGEETVFKTSDGMHHAEIISQNNKTVIVKLQMQDVTNFKKEKDHFVIDTGSPHYVCFTKNVSAMDVYTEGRKIRQSGEFVKEGINVNFAESFNGFIYVRTYERGVEDETLSCGTGATAVSVAANEMKFLNENYCNIKTKGGNLKVYFSKSSNSKYTDIWLEGPTVEAYKGEFNI
jgi:diaminopimelate epimerase